MCHTCLAAALSFLANTAPEEAGSAKVRKTRVLKVSLVPMAQAMTGTSLGHLLWYICFCLVFLFLSLFGLVYWKDVAG